ncbi:PKD domain-containing protein, partial [bacterium AH-315-M05]|nr:PKD domain-containing protein [bacterium AH-315-M05]
TPDGGYIISGLTTLAGFGAWDISLMKIDAGGNVQWFRTYGGGGNDYGQFVQLTTDGGYIISGQQDSYGVGGLDVFLLKTDNTGNVQWMKTYGGGAADHAAYVEQTSDGGYIITASTGSFGTGGQDLWLIKTDGSGNVQWTKTYGGTGAEGEHWNTEGQITFDGGYIIATSTTSFGAGSNDLLLVKTDNLGNVQWSNAYGGTGDDGARSVRQTPDGGYAITGYTTSFGAGGRDFYLVKTDSSGALEWSKAYGGPGTEKAMSVQPTNDGGYVMSGNTTSFGANNYDVYIVKTDTIGNTTCYQNNAATVVTNVSPDTSSGVLVTSPVPGFASPSPTVNNFSPPENFLCLDCNLKFASFVNCQNQLKVYFTDSSLCATAWRWDFGDGDTSNIQNPTHTYALPGTYDVQLIAQNVAFGCEDTLILPVTVDTFPIADFSAASVCLGDTTRFVDQSDTSLANIIGWWWDFDDGFTDTVQYPSHLYSAYGTYNVSLAITADDACEDTIVKSVTVNPLPIADFTAASVCFGMPTQFMDSSTVPSGSITSWNWNFGDSNASTQQNPSHLYSAAGLYNVTLLAATDSGCVDSITKVIVVHYVPLANFNSTNVCLNDTMVFNNTSLISFGSIVSWQWDFGDGVGTSTLQYPTYIFNIPDTFIVTLSVTSDSGCTSIVGYPVVVYPLPIAGFTTANVCLYDDAVFTNSSTVSSGSVTSWQWDFGDGNTASTQNPAHLYSVDSTYNVTLIVTSNNNCLDTIVQPIQIYPIPIAGFSTNNVCLYDPAVFSDTSTISSGSIISFDWDFGDGNTSTTQSPTYLYSLDGTYNVSLIVTTNNSCVDTVVDTLIIYPVPSPGFTTGNVCLYDAAVFTDVTTINNPDNIASWQWDFGDGLGTSTMQNPSYNYGSDGLYNVQLTVTSNNNCIDNTALTIEIYPLPVMNFISDTFRGCEPFCVNFFDLTTITNGTISIWDWDFGDGSTSSEQNPENCYTAIDVNTTRISTVTLIATSSNGCLDTLLQVDTITTWPNPIAEFMAEPQPTTILNPVINFTDQSQGDTIAWAWDFGDGFTNTIQNPVHEYLDTGSYIVEQIIVNQFLCPDTFYRTIIIQPGYIFHVPNAFTPNKDGKNEVFIPQGIGIDEENFEMIIYDRWGNLIYETNDINKPWDGRANNGRKIAQQDVYVWVIFTKDILGKRHRYIGHVTLVR